MPVKIVREAQYDIITEEMISDLVIRCSCGGELELEDPITNRCECGVYYNGGGQELQDLEEWDS